MISRFRLLCLLICLLPAWVAADGKTIVIVGDSLSAAYGMELSESWPSLLQQRLDQDGHAYRVFNSSIAGETTQGGLTRLPRLLEQHEPEIVIVELGGNDGLRGLPIEVTRGNLSSMIEQSLAAGAKVLLAEMRIPPNYGRTYTEQFNGTYAELAGQHGIVLLPFLLQDIALEPGLMQADGIHPTAAAQPIILDQFWAALEPLL
ncbi:MAG: arylesterase [Xanthomonadales bacterium]|jgi:acyl-CoA thioesterase-1|nr:arylesterase [Xanthomonadales bacterium]